MIYYVKFTIFLNNSTFYCNDSNIENNHSNNSASSRFFQNSNINIKNSTFKDNSNQMFQYPDIYFLSCTGLMELVNVSNYFMEIESSTIQLTNCNIPLLNVE